MMDSEGAEVFAKENGIETRRPEIFFYPERWELCRK